MPISKTVVSGEGEEYVWDVFEDTKQMSTYLLAFVVSDLECKPGKKTSNNVTFQVCSRSDVINQTNFAAEIGPEILEYYEHFFQVDFPLPKQDLVAVPGKSGAMENWGLITYGEDVLLFEDGVSSLADQEHVVQVIAHELSHQWFGDLVTMKWWSE